MTEKLDQLEALMREAEDKAQQYRNDANHRSYCYESIYSSFCRIANDIGVPVRRANDYKTDNPEDTMRAYLRLHGR